MKQVKTIKGVIVGLIVLADLLQFAEREHRYSHHPILEQLLYRYLREYTSGFV